MSRRFHTFLAGGASRWLALGLPVLLVLLLARLPAEETNRQGPATAAPRVAAVLPAGPSPGAIPLQLLAGAAGASLPASQAPDAFADDDPLLLSLTRTPVTLTNGQQVLAFSFFSDSNHNYVVEFRDELGHDLCHQWQPLVNAPHNYGILFTENQPTNRFFRLRRIDVPRSPLFALLANDSGTNSLDGLTHDPTVTGLALQFPDGTELQASLDQPDGPFLTVTNLGSPRYFLLTPDDLARVHGAPLPDGPRVLHLRAVRGAEILGAFDLAFTLDTRPPELRVELDPAYDSPPLGDGRTTFNPVTLRGLTEPGARLALLNQPGLVIQAAPDGSFTLPEVVLADGANPFLFQSLDAACNEAVVEFTVVRAGDDCAFTGGLDGWQTRVSPGPGMPGAGGVTVDGPCAVRSPRAVPSWSPSAASS